MQTDAKRLKLESVQEKACDNSASTPPYIFNYFSEQVPRRLSFGQDHWGFYNGVTTNSTLIPTYTENEFTVFSGAEGGAKWPAMRGGALQKILYPTAGSTTFDFAPNSTWASTKRYNNASAFSISVGFTSANDNVREEFHTLTNNPYIITYTNQPTGGSGGVRVYDNTNTVVFTLYGDPGESKEGTVKLPAGTYKVVVTKSTVDGTGKGASSSFTQRIPYTYDRNEIVGGLRITSITNSLSVGTNSVTNYSYSDYNEHSTGVLYSRPA